MEQEVQAILLPVFEAEGYYVLEYDPDFGHNAHVDYVAYKAASGNDTETSIGVVHARTESLIDLAKINSLLGECSRISCNRAMILALSSFTPEAMIAAAHSDPVAVDLLDFARLRAWAHGQKPDDQGLDSPQITFFRQQMMQQFIRHLARYPMQMHAIEWRELEHIVAEICEGLGFEVLLTPPAKDKGRDIILTATITRKKKKYLVELKHWAAPNRVCGKTLKEFVNVVVKDNADQGLILSTSGYACNALTQITEIERVKFRMGSQGKIYGLCRTYIQKNAGLWSPEVSLADVLFEHTY